MPEAMKRKRYIVVVEGSNETQSAVIIARNLKGMYREVNRLYGHLLKDVNGRDIGKLSFKETELQ
ncbi:hypothetical protein [Bacillus sp. ISL-45]|uniref:hypothetical protein n=1 Tax=Bacillus sp. ISL-45 TaxID=2819128 RepID=UPI001BEC4465|nr:hypothetical protein [Bacillus sp. ISL-45]MBT2661959.1 hypothetical protein [Bacillus sp. ISL-45]